MPRYIDADGLIKKVFPYDVVDKKCYTINAKMIYEAIQEAPTADVVPRSEEGAECPICHGIGRINTTDWLIRHVSKKRLAKEKAKAIAEHERYIKDNVAREIFAGIQACLIQRHWNGLDIVSFELDAVKYAELKKKYVPDTNDGNITAAEAIANFHEAAHEYYTDNNHCVVCGESVPEGRQVCGMCETGQEFLKKRKE